MCIVNPPLGHLCGAWCNCWQWPQRLEPEQVVVGSCERCGSPIYGPKNWYGFGTPPTKRTCSCQFNHYPRLAETPKPKQSLTKKRSNRQW